ncbi:MAG: hypothetical protein Q4D29_13440 [Lachnospiraceae bacterium]|nr:hypothetical protein [Lachnospiraceae bacterium]
MAAKSKEGEDYDEDEQKKRLCGIAVCLYLVGSAVPVFADTVRFNITIPGDIIFKQEGNVPEVIAYADKANERLRRLKRHRTTNTGDILKEL